MSKFESCLKCKYSGKEVFQEPCNKCKHNTTYTLDRYTPMTNADRIRSMSDEKLADFLYAIDHYDDEGEPIVVLSGKRITDFPDNIFYWLQKEVAE